MIVLWWFKAEKKIIMDKKVNLSLSWKNITEAFKLDKRDSSEYKIFPLDTIENSSFSFNFSLNTSANFNHTQQQSWIQIATRIIPLYSVIFLLAVIGNSLVILTLVQNKRMRTITNLFLLNLAVSDLFLGVFCMPFTLVGMLLRDFIFGELMCKLLPYLQGLSVIDLFKFLIIDHKKNDFANKVHVL